MLEHALQETFARHESLVPDGAHIIEAAATTARNRRRRRWAVSGTAAATVVALAVAAPAAVRWAMPIKQQSLLPGSVIEDTAALDGRPLNFLLLGLDKRTSSSDPVRSDTVMIAHVTADRSEVDIITIERDVLVKGPAGENLKLTERYPEGGFAAVAESVSAITGLKFDGGATIQFDGLKKIVAALGGIHVCIDQVVRSEHYDANGVYHTSTSRDGVKPYTYQPGCRDLKPWEALDYARQREGLPHGAYDRDRHVIDVLSAIVKKAVATVGIDDPVKLAQFLQAAGDTLVVDTGGSTVGALATTIRPALKQPMVKIATPLGGYHSENINGMSFQVIDDVTKQFYAALRDDQVAAWVAKHGTR